MFRFCWEASWIVRYFRQNPKRRILKGCLMPTELIDVWIALDDVKDKSEKRAAIRHDTPLVVMFVDRTQDLK